MKQFFLILSIVISFTLGAEILGKDSWVIEWGELEGINLSLSNQLLLTSIPTFFMENIDSDLHHYTDESERLLVFNKVKQLKNSTLLTSRTDLITKKDTLFFDSETTSNTEKIEQSIIEVDKEIEEIEQYNLDEKSFPDNFEIEFQPESSNEISSIKDYEIFNYLDREEIDYYVTGTVEEDFDNLFVTIKLYSKYSDKAIIIWSGIGDSEEILNYRPEMLSKLSRIIFTDKILSYTIEIIPNDALIYVNDVFKGLGRYEGYTVDKDDIDIEILKEGYNSISLTKHVSNEKELFQIELKPFELQTVTVTSKPSGALAYYGSKYIGTTPLDVPLYTYLQKLTLSSEGYMDKSIILDSKSKDIEVKLHQGVFNREDNFVLEKSNFYIATGIFSVALGIPLYFTAVDGDIDDVVMNISIGNAVFWGLNLFYRLYSYLGAAEISVE